MAPLPPKVAAFDRAMATMARITGKPILYGPNNRPLMPSAEYAYRRVAAKRTGSLRNWTPRQHFSRQSEALDRRFIVQRSIELSENDPHASGVIDTMATLVVGPGLRPRPTLDHELLGIDKNQARRLQRLQLAAWHLWEPSADAGGRMTFGQLQYLRRLSIMRYGECFTLLPMIDDPLRSFSLACKVIHPLRVKTPLDLEGKADIQDGIELGPWGRTRAVWIKKATPQGRTLADTSANFLRIPVRKGHRWQILHNYVCKDPEQVRGYPLLAPALKTFRDFSDLLDAELVSNVVTAALSYFIETLPGDSPYWGAQDQQTGYDWSTGFNGTLKKNYYQEVAPGQIWYGNSGEKPHLLAASRPGVTFEPFTMLVKKGLAMACNMPYSVLFKDVADTDFAGFRAAMLDAWKVVTMERTWDADGYCQPIYTMLQEEAYLKGHFSMPRFYSALFHATRADWRGAPKGDIEPVKEAQADVILAKNNLKPKSQILAERGMGGVYSTFEQISEERELERSKNIVPQEKGPGMTSAQKEKADGAD